MNEYDVVIVGAGPAGSAAAKAVAERGLKAILLEEHPAVGVPSHCSGGLTATTRPEAAREILRSLDKRVILREYHTRRVFAPSGKVHDVSLAGRPTYLVERDDFDRDLAKQAVNAGANLVVNTRVTGLLKQEGRVIGVTTNSTTMPNVYGKVVIGTDGIYAMQRGIPKWEGLTGAGQTFTGGILFELTRVRDIDPDICELHCGAFIKKGYTTLWPRDNGSCMTHFMTMAEFERAKAGNYVLSRKLRDAIPVRMTGFNHASDLGVGLPKVVEEGLILAGSSANLRGIWAAIASGCDAGEVAVEAVQEDDVTVEKLSKYEALFKRLILDKGFLDTLGFSGLSDENIEDILLRKIERDELSFFTKPHPF